METRRDRFRRQLAQLAGTGNPQNAIDAGFYVPRPASSERLARRIELQPAALRVLTGPIGSGKSTELLVLAQELNRLPDIWAVVIDVSLVHDLADLREGTLIAAALLAVAETLNLSSELTQGLREFAYGTSGNGSGATLAEMLGSGVLTPPKLKITVPIEKLLREVLATVKDLKGRTPVFLFDSLDRVRDATGFRIVLERDARMLVDKGFGVVLTAPIDTLWSDSGELRALTETWDVLPYTDPANDSTAREFLREILRCRADLEILPEPTWLPLVLASGGVIRDLVELARNAVEEAYFEGSEQVGPREVDAAISHFARALALGLDGAAIAMLITAQDTQLVRAFDEGTLRLLKNRKILEHRDSLRSYYEPHPVLRPMLERWAEAS